MKVREEVEEREDMERRTKKGSKQWEEVETSERGREGKGLLTNQSRGWKGPIA